jgi:hypothetical protein
MKYLKNKQIFIRENRRRFHKRVHSGSQKYMDIIGHNI